ncbi:Glycerol-3-phosphate dehydrogenase [NAD(P)+], partial [hydrothermal vent metagenome]
MDLRVGLLGGGSWGTTVASIVSRNAPIRIWARDEETVADINNNHRNSKYLPDAELPEALTATNDIGEAVSSCDVLVMGIPSSNFRSVLEQAKQHLRPWVP